VWVDHIAHRPVQAVALPWSGRVWDPDERAALLGVDLAAVPAPRTPVAAVAGEAPPDPLPIRVRWALRQAAFDRSAAHHRLVGHCREAGLTPGQTIAVVAGYAPSCEKYGERMAAEVPGAWPRRSPGPGRATWPQSWNWMGP
jgi:hypothetical protein